MSETSKPGLNRREAFVFELPDSQIATHPVEPRDHARLMEVQGTARHHHRFDVLPDVLAPGDLLVVNDVRVRACRLFAEKSTGGRVELLILDARPDDDATQWHVTAMVRANRALHEGQVLTVPVADQVVKVHYRGRDEMGQAQLDVAWAGDINALFEAAGEMPLPPYIVKQRKQHGEAHHREADRDDYQTVYAREGMAVAAPTAGLHFTTRLLDALEARGVKRAALRLDVGAGTFQPVKTETLDAHKMHHERYVIEPALVEAVAETRARGGRVIAVGTTVVRALEDQMARWGMLKPGSYSTDLFIKMDHTYRAIDGLITNFHLPGSTLIVLVAALGGYDAIMAAYGDAVAKKYRFYSYGDAMLVWPHAAG